MWTVCVCWWAVKPPELAGSHSGASVPPAPSEAREAAGLPEKQAGPTGAVCGLAGREVPGPGCVHQPGGCEPS